MESNFDISYTNPYSIPFFRRFVLDESQHAKSTIKIIFKGEEMCLTG